MKQTATMPSREVTSDTHTAVINGPTTDKKTTFLLVPNVFSCMSDSEVRVGQEARGGGQRPLPPTTNPPRPNQGWCSDPLGQRRVSAGEGEGPWI